MKDILLKRLEKYNLNIPHNSPYHEETIYEHIAAGIENAPDDYMAALSFLHDLGKPYTKKHNDDKGYCTYMHHGKYVPYSLFKEDVEFLIEEFGVSGFRELLYLAFYHMDYRFKHNQNILNYSFNNSKYFDLLDDFSKIDEKSRKGIPSDYNLSNFCKYNPTKITKRKVYDNVKIIFPIGIPAIGKSTYMNKLKDDIIVFSNDNIVEKYGCGDTYDERWNDIKNKGNIHELQQKELKEIRKKIKSSNEDVVIYVDNTNMTKKSRELVLNQIPAADVSYILFLNKFENILKQNEKREKTIPIESIEYMMGIFNLPPINQTIIYY